MHRPPSRPACEPALTECAAHSLRGWGRCARRGATPPPGRPLPPPAAAPPSPSSHPLPLSITQPRRHHRAASSNSWTHSLLCAAPRSSHCGLGCVIPPALGELSRQISASTPDLTSQRIQPVGSRTGWPASIIGEQPDGRPGFSRPPHFLMRCPRAARAPAASAPARGPAHRSSPMRPAASIAQLLDVGLQQVARLRCRSRQQPLAQHLRHTRLADSSPVPRTRPE